MSEIPNNVMGLDVGSTLVRPILQDDDDRLKTVSLDVTEFNADLADLVYRMMATMVHAKGRGISAIQIGEAKRVLIAVTDGKVLAMVNPMFLRKLNREVYEWEGCLSIPPAQWRYVSRPAKCEITWQDLNGDRLVDNFSGDMARVLQHEMDHLDGILITDKPDVKRL